MTKPVPESPKRKPSRLQSVSVAISVLSFAIVVAFLLMLVVQSLAANTFKYRPEIVSGIARVQFYRAGVGVSVVDSDGSIHRLQCLPDKDYGCWQILQQESIAVAKPCPRGAKREACWPQSAVIQLGEPVTAILLKRSPRIFGEPLLLALRSDDGVIIPVEDGAERLQLSCKNLKSPLPAGDWGNMGTLAHCP